MNYVSSAAFDLLINSSKTLRYNIEEKMPVRLQNFVDTVDLGNVPNEWLQNGIV